MDSAKNTASDVPESNVVTELELTQQTTENVEGNEESEVVPMDVSNSSKTTDEVHEPIKEMANTSQTESTPKKTIEVKTTTPLGSQSITIIMSPSSSSQKTQTVRLINPEQMSSLSMQTIQLPIKTSPIVLKATTIPMPTKTVSIIAKPSTSTLPGKATSTTTMPSLSKTQAKSFGIRKSVGVGKGDSSSKSEAALRQMVRPGGVTKAKMQSARVIVVPLQITKEMIAAKQKAAGKTSKLGVAVAGKGELGSKPGTVSIGESSASDKKFSTKGKVLKKGMAFKRKDEGVSEVKTLGVASKTLLKVAGKATKNVAFAESDSESEKLDLSFGKSEKVTQDKRKAAEDHVKGNEDLKEGKDESNDSEAEQGGTARVSKVKKVSRKKDESLEGSDVDVGESKTKQLNKNKIGEDVDSEVENEMKPKAVSAKSKNPKKYSKKSEREDEDDEKQDLGMEPKCRLVSSKDKSKIESLVNAEVEAHDSRESKQTKEITADLNSEDLEVKSVTNERKTKKAKAEDGEGHIADSETDEDHKSDSESVKVKKTPGRKRKDKTKEEPVAVTSTRRSKRESNLSVKLAEWGLVPLATPKSHAKSAVLKTPTTKSPATTKSSASTKTPVASKTEATQSPVASKSVVASKSHVTARSPVAAQSPSTTAVSPIALVENVSPPVSPGKQQQLPQAGVTVTVVRNDTSAEPPEEASVESSANDAPAKPSIEKPATKSGSEWIAKASSILSSGTPKAVQKATPKVTPKAAKVDKPTTVQPVKQLIKVPEKVIISKAVEVKQMQNKSLMCKPIMMTKATSCNPIRINKDTQTDGSNEGRKKKTMFVPVPVPFILPAPVATCAMPAPFPVPLPVPLPVPCFIPSTRKSIDNLMKSLQELHDQMPSDPFEADLLAMAEAVTAAHNEVPDCIMEPEDIKPIMRSGPHIGVAATTLQQQSCGGESSEDMLELALRMATEMPEEGSLEIEAVRERMASHPEASQTAEFGAILQNGSTCAKRASSASDDERNHGKKARLEVFAGSHSVSGSAVAFATALPISESHMKLKYSYGVKAWKYWVSEKNAELENAPSASKGRSKLFKQEILQCGTDELNLTLSLFVKEVRKPTGEEYAPDSIYYLCLGIQHYLYENGRIDNVFTDFYYKGFTDALNAQLSGFQVCLNTQGMIVCRVTEEHLWETRQLGAHSPYVLLNTLIYFNTKYFQLNSAEMHMSLSFANIMKQFKKSIASSDAKQGRTVYLRYNPTTAYTGIDGARRKMAVPPVNPSEQLENSDNPLRCPVKLYEFYLSKCPETIRNRSDLFYLTPEVSCVPDSPVWYSTVPLGTEVMSKMLNRILVVREIQEACLNLQPVFG